MTQNESQLKSSLKRKLEDPECNALIYPSVGSVFTVRGIPDWYVAHRIWRGWLEIKDEDNPYSPHQKTQIRRLISRGDNAFGLRRKGSLLFLETITDKDTVETAGSVPSRGLTGVGLLTWLRGV